MKTQNKVLTGAGVLLALGFLWYAFKPKKSTANNTLPASGGGGGITTTLPPGTIGQTVNNGDCTIDKNCVPDNTGGIKPIRDYAPVDTGGGTGNTDVNIDSGSGPILSPGHLDDSFWAGGTYCNPAVDKNCDPTVNW